MPAVGGDVTHIRTSAETLAHLESIETANFDTGDEAVIKTTLDRYELDKSSLAARDGTTVLYTKNALLAADPATTPGRWLLFSEGSGATGATGPAGPTGATGATGDAGPLEVQNGEDHFVVDTTITESAIFGAILSTGVTTDGATEQLKIDFSFSGEAPTDAATFIALIQVDGSPIAESSGTAQRSSGPGNVVSGAISRIVDVAPGAHLIEIIARSQDGDFDINAGTVLGQHASLTVLRLGPAA